MKRKYSKKRYSSKRKYSKKRYNKQKGGEDGEKGIFSSDGSVAAMKRCWNLPDGPERKDCIEATQTLYG